MEERKLKEILRIIFLDIDGVLNHELFYRDRYEGKNDAKSREYPLSEIDFVSVGYLNQLVLDTGAKVVISSTWRSGRSTEELQDILNQAGFVGEVIDKTPSLRNLGDAVLRGNEIYKWLKDNEEVYGSKYHSYNNYVIFDDDSDMLYWQRNNFFLVDRYAGLSPNICYRAKKVLMGDLYNREAYEL